ncbi:hypothetical protein BJY00DRAFT_205071 [Aspergillus carlsbadensis]|nr:hypothetical protein BJY00DRAFT_205071 [Aspergillus carlsbadensis]
MRGPVTFFRAGESQRPCLSNLTAQSNRPTPLQRFGISRGCSCTAMERSWINHRMVQSLFEIACS